MTYYLRSALVNPGFWSYALIVVTFGGTAFLMWLGELITERGIGNGISLIIFAGIVSGLPRGIFTLYQYVVLDMVSIITIIVYLIMSVVVIAGVVAIHEGKEKFLFSMLNEL